MSVNNNFSCIPFYTSLEEQDYRKWYAYGREYVHRVPNNFLIPFFLVVPSHVFNISAVVCYKLDGTLHSNITQAMVDNGLALYSNNNVTCVVYPANNVTALDLPAGCYYLRIDFVGTEGGPHYWSDVFYVEPPALLLKNTIKLEWCNIYNLAYSDGLIPYESGFKNILYVITEIGKPDYNFTEEGEERNGRFFATKQISEKVYKFSFVAPEYICDALRLVRMSDFINITDRLGRVYNLESFEPEVNWLEFGYFAEVNCSFNTDTVVKKTGLGYIDNVGDFNNSYNNDYNNQ